MSIKGIKREIEYVNRVTGGSTFTLVARDTALRHTFDVWRRELNLQIRSFRDLKTSQVEAFVRHEQEAGKSIRSIQNDLAHLRSALRAFGREQFANSTQMSNKALGVSGASRDGTHRPLTGDQYQQALEAARERDAGFAAALQLQRELGLRAQEAIRSVESLTRWEKAIERGDPRVHVIHGTKGGRPRDTGPLDRNRALGAVREALRAVEKNGGQLIRSQTLRGALRTYGRRCEAIGLKGEHASHALRCMYAHDRYEQHLLACDGNRREALAETALDLGHGDGRGTYVAQVYIRS